MDIEENYRQQETLAKQIVAIWDDCSGDGSLTKDQADEVSELADQLSELVLAAAGWRKKTEEST